MKNIRKVSAFHQNWWYKPLSVVNPHKPSKIGGFSPYGMWFSISYQMVRWKPLPIGWLVYPHGSPWIPIAFMVNLRGWYYGIYQYRGRERGIYCLTSALLLVLCIWFTVNSCDKPIAMLEYVYVYINWHSKLIYIYIYIYLLLVY